MTFEEWWAKHGGMFSTREQAAYAAWHGSRPPRRVPIPDPDDPDKTMWCHPCVASVSCPNCDSPPGVPCKGAALMGSPWKRNRASHGNGKRYTLLPHHLRVTEHGRKKREQP